MSCAVRIASPGHAQISPDGRLAALTAGGLVHVYRVDAGGLCKLAEFAGHAAAWSPDSMQLAYASGPRLLLWSLHTSHAVGAAAAPDERPIGALAWVAPDIVLVGAGLPGARGRRPDALATLECGERGVLAARHLLLAWRPREGPGFAEVLRLEHRIVGILPRSGTCPVVHVSAGGPPALWHECGVAVLRSRTDASLAPVLGQPALNQLAWSPRGHLVGALTYAAHVAGRAPGAFSAIALQGCAAGGASGAGDRALGGASGIECLSDWHPQRGLAVCCAGGELLVVDFEEAGPTPGWHVRARVPAGAPPSGAPRRAVRWVASGRLLTLDQDGAVRQYDVPAEIPPPYVA